MENDNYRKYLVLDIRNANLLVETLDPKISMKNENVAKICAMENVKAYRVFKGHDLRNPIPHTLLSNMLTSLMGGVPVPTKPSKRSRMAFGIQRPLECDELAMNARIHVSTPFDTDMVEKGYIGTDGEYYFLSREGARLNGYCGELMKAEKLPINSNTQHSTLLFTFDNGEEKNVKGYTFTDMAKAIYDLEKDNDEVKARIADFVAELACEWKGNYFTPWMDAIFNYSNTDKTFHVSTKTLKGSPNTDSKESKPHGNTFLRNRRGVSHKQIPVSGRIVVELTDKRFEDAIRANRGFCTCLEGGVCEVVGLENFNPVAGNEDEWPRISELESLQYIQL